MKNHPNYSVGCAMRRNPRTKLRPHRRWSFAANFTLGVLIIVTVLVLKPLAKAFLPADNTPRHGDL